MNEIEQRFYDAWIDYEEADSIEAEKVIGPYKVDFLVYETAVVEIDGHEFHKTKEQRDHDYKRERYLQSKGYIVIRFMGTEVFLSADKCVEETLTIARLFEEKIIDSFWKGHESGKKQSAKASANQCG